MMAFLSDRQWSVVMMRNTSKISNYVQIILFFKLLDPILTTPLEQQVDWNAKWKEVVDDGRAAFDQARERLYPLVPIRPTHPSLNLDKHIGLF